MLKSISLKFKSNCYLFILSILNVFAFSFIIGCSNNTNKTNENLNKTADSIARVKKINDSIAKEKIKQDSINEIYRINDSITRADSIKKAKHKKINFKPVTPAMKYGCIPNKY